MGLPHASAFIFVILLEGEGGSGCCCPAVVSDHTSLLRCVSLFVKGEMVSGPPAKGQGSIIECFVPGDLGEEPTESGNRELHSQLQGKSSSLMTWYIQLSGIKVFGFSRKSIPP